MDVIELIEEGEVFYENGDAKSAKSKFLQASLLAPEDPQIYNRLGMLEMSRASPDKARLFYERICYNEFLDSTQHILRGKNSVILVCILLFKIADKNQYFVRD